MTQPSIVVQLTRAGSQGTEYTEGQRLLLPEATARWFAERGYALLLDPDDTEPTQ